MVNRNQKGYVLSVVIILITTLAVLSIGLLPNITAQIRFNRMDEDRLIAQYAAESGAKTALRQIQQTYNSYADNNSGTVTIADILSINSANTTPENFIYHPDKAKFSSYTVQFAPDNITDPKKIQVTANGFFNGKRYTVRPFFSLKLQRTGGIKELFNDCTYSRKDGTAKNPTAWIIDTENNAANPPDDGYGYSQVLFTGCELDEKFSLAYNCACKAISSTTESGYGIYYGSTGDADNMTSYVLQYDPGARHQFDDGSFDDGSFFVKKCRTNSTIQSRASANEWIETTTTQYLYTTSSFIGTKGTTYTPPKTTSSGSGLDYKITVIKYKYVTDEKEKNEWGWIRYQTYIYKITTTGQYRDKVYTKYPPCYPFQVEDTASKTACLNTDNTFPTETSTENIYRVSLNALKSHMEDAIRHDKDNPNPNYTFDIYGTHKITITVDTPWHKIYCDGHLILKFVDTTVTCPITFKGKYSGLRVWNAKVGFYDYPNESYGQGTRPVIWTK